MNIKNELLGFDAREMWHNFQSTWRQERKDFYLLRQNISKPLSTDTIVWPSVFDDEKRVGLLTAELNSLILPSWIGPNRPLWDNLEHLKGYLAAQYIAKEKPYWIIAIARLSENIKPNDSVDCWPYFNTTNSAVLDESWKLLGFDVSDQSMLSGLSNCGYSDESENVQSLRDRWGPHLNSYHLFDKVEQAVAFKEFSNQRVREHAPFFVYGLWLIEVG